MRWLVSGVMTMLASLLLACDASSDRAASVTPLPTATATQSGHIPSSPPSDAAPVSATPVLPLHVYFEQVLPVVEGYVLATGAALALVATPRPDAAVWRAQLQETVDPLRIADHTLQGVMPPGCLAPAHTALQQAMATARRASDVVAVVVATQNTDGLDVVKQLLQASLDAVRAATVAMRKADC